MRMWYATVSSLCLAYIIGSTLLIRRRFWTAISLFRIPLTSHVDDPVALRFDNGSLA